MVFLEVISEAWEGADVEFIAVMEDGSLCAVLVPDSCWCLMLLLREEIFGRLFAFSD